MTTLKDEKQAQNQWKLRAGIKLQHLFDTLLENEFAEVEKLESHIDSRVGIVTEYAATYSPYYQAIFKKEGISSDQLQSFEDLEQLPILTKDDLVDYEEKLVVPNLPADEKKTLTYTFTSGTSGKRGRILLTRYGANFFTFLMARNYRWFRMNPMQRFAALREPRWFTFQNDEAPPMENVRIEKAWHSVGQIFHTGPALYVTSTSALEKQQEMLKQFNPTYLQGYPSVLEEHAFADPDAKILTSLESLLAISAHLTEPMRNRIEAAYKAPVNQNYGVNEIGIIAARCEAGRYHVHTEHCLVEITDFEGRQCKPGESGRITVTGLNNAAMPLLRYDTGDYAALPLNKDCDCGRTLPSFENIYGRYRRWLNVPPGTKHRFTSITNYFETLPTSLLANVRGYQVHLKTNGCFIFKIMTKDKIPDEIKRLLHHKWNETYPEETDKFSVLQVSKLEAPMSQKVPDFTSDYDETPRNFELS